MAEQKPDDHYFEIQLTHAQRQVVLKALGAWKLGQSKHEARDSAIEAIRAGKRVELPLEQIDWEAAQAEAERRGCSLEDLFFDQAHAKEPDHG